MNTCRLVLLAALIATPAFAQGDRTIEVGKPKVNNNADTQLGIAVVRRENGQDKVYNVVVTIPKGENWSAEKKAQELVKAYQRALNNGNAPQRNLFGARNNGPNVTFGGGKRDNYVSGIVGAFDTTGESDKWKVKDGFIQLGKVDFSLGLPATSLCSGKSLDASGLEIPGATMTFGVEGLYVSTLPVSPGETGASVLGRLFLDLHSNAPDLLASAISYTPGRIDIDFGAELIGGAGWSFVTGFDDLGAGGDRTWEWIGRAPVPAPGALATLGIAAFASRRRAR